MVADLYIALLLCFRRQERDFFNLLQINGKRIILIIMGFMR